MAVKLLAPMALMEFSYLLRPVISRLNQFSQSKEDQMSLVSCLAEAWCAY